MTELELTNLSPEHNALVTGQVIVYPTEAVWGIGCDPLNEEAVQQLLALKQRPVEKGLILIAKDYAQLMPFVDDNTVPIERRAEIFSSWPGPYTWLMPAASTAPRWITGGSDLIAVRVTEHPTVRRICDEFAGPIVSTSANITGEPTPETLVELQSIFADQVCYVDAPLGESLTPSTIKNAMTGEVIRG